MQAVKQAIFFETIANEVENSHLEQVDGVITHVITGLKGVVLIPIFYDDIPGNSVATYLELLGLLDLLPSLVPDHPAADFAKTLYRSKKTNKKASD